MKLKTAMLLAAGRGQRLAPLTDQTPKPLLPLYGKSLIVYHIEQLRTLGIEKIIINVSYLAKQIMETLGDGSAFGVHIEYSYEEEALGAGGGVRQVLSLLGQDPFLLISSDIYTDFPLAQFFAPQWSLGDDLLHVVVTDKKPYNAGDFNLQDNRLLMAEQPTFIYGSIAVMSPSIFINEPQAKSGLMPAFKKVIQHNQASGVYYKNIVNINTLEEYKQFSHLEV